MQEGPNRKGASPAIKNLVNRSNKLLVLNAFLSIVMCVTRFDYNIALSLGLMLFLELHQNDYFDFFRPAGLICLFFSFIDILWIFMVHDCWLFTAPTGTHEKSIHSKMVVLRWITFICSIVSLILKLIIGFGLISSSKVEAYTGYVQLENAQTGRAADHNSGSPKIPPKQENLVAVNGGLNAELSSGAGRTHTPVGPR